MRKIRSNISGNGQGRGPSSDSPPLWVMGVAIAITAGVLGLLMAA